MITPRPRLQEECLALATGLLTTSPPSESDVNRAEKLLNKVEMHIRAFLKAETPDKWECWERPPEQSELRQDLLKTFDPEELLDEPSAAGPELLGKWILVLTNARQYVTKKWPVYDEQALTPANYELAPDEYGDVWELTRAVDGIENLFGDWRSHMLSAEQVEAARACYPDFMATVDEMLMDELAAHIAKKRKLTWQQEDQIRVMRNLPGEEPITVQAPPPRQKKEPKANLEKTVNQMRTQAERVDAGDANR